MLQNTAYYYRSQLNELYQLMNNCLKQYNPIGYVECCKQFHHLMQMARDEGYAVWWDGYSYQVDKKEA